MTLHKLTAKRVKSLPDGVHSDGGNLYLRVRGTARSWIFRYRLNGVSTDLGLGSARDVPLSLARERAAELRTQIASGISPAYARRKAKARQMEEQERSKAHPLREFAQEALEHYMSLKRLRTPRWIPMMRNTLETHAFPLIGNFDVAAVTKKEIAAVLAPLWVEHQSTAVHVLNGLRILFKYAQLNEWVEGVPPVSKDSGLMELLPKRGESTPRRSIPWKDIPTFYKALSGLPPSVFRVQMMVIVLTAARQSEILKLEQSDIDLKNSVIYVRHRKDGAKTPFRIPVTAQLDALLRGVSFTGSWGSRHDKDKNNKVIASLGYDATMHGFRSSFSTWCADNGKDPILRELSLCHKVDNAVAAAYQRSDLLERRRVLLQEWNDFVTHLTAS